jgi:Zn-dependent protease with chaperone function
MLLTATLLAAFAVALAWPVPIILARAHWPAAAPGVALLLWQAIALAGGLSMIGALLTYGLISFGDHLVAALVSFVSFVGTRALPPGTNFFEMFALSGAILLGGHLVLNLALTFVRAGRQRSRHRQLVGLLSSPMPEAPGMRILDHAAPVAYCMPGAPRSITVLSAGLIELLDDEQLRAVIAHERAHLTQRHHVVLLGFRAWRSALPWFPIASRAQDAVGVLVEMLADDTARHEVPDHVLAQAVALVASADDASADDSPLRVREGIPAASEASVRRRVSRLVDGTGQLALPSRIAVGALAVALVAVPTFLLVLPTFA